MNIETEVEKLVIDFDELESTGGNLQISKEDRDKLLQKLRDRKAYQNKMSSDPNFDGLCGIVQPAVHAGGVKLRCLHPFGHDGPHSWEKYPGVITGGTRATSYSVVVRTKAANKEG